MIIERLGVPDDINEEADKLYNELKKDIHKIDDIEDKILIGKYDIKISDLKVKNIPFYVNLQNVVADIKPTLTSLGHAAKPEIEKDDSEKLKINRSYERSNLSMTIAYNDSINKNDIVELFDNNVDSAQIAHELKHLYDAYKKPKEEIENISNYQSVQFGGLPDVIEEILHLLYYLNNIENLVRPTEMYQYLLNNNVKKSNFKDFMRKSEIIEKVNNASNFSLEKFKEELSKDKQVNDLLNKAEEDGEDFDRTGDNAEDIMNLAYNNIKHNYMDTVEKIIQNYIGNPLERIFGGIFGDEEDIKEKEKIAEKNFNRILAKAKNDSMEKFFVRIEKNLNFEGNKMKKKLYKLYDMLDDDNKNKYIKNWKLHNKINSKNEKLIYTLDFNRFRLKK